MCSLLADKLQTETSIKIVIVNMNYKIIMPLKKETYHKR